MTIGEMLHKLLTFLFNTHPTIRATLIGSSVLIAAWKLFSRMWQELFAKLDNLLIPETVTSVDFSPLGLVDAVFPLHECLTFIVAYAALRLVAVVIRIIKSFIPSIA